MERLLERLRETGLRGERLLDALSLLVALRVEGAAGRPRLSRILGLGERRTRNLLDLLSGAALVEKGRGGSRLTGEARRLLEGVRLQAGGGRTCCFLPAPCDAVRRLEGNIVRARDAIAIMLADPGRLIVLGCYTGSGLELPGVPEEIAARYRGMIEPCIGKPGGCGVAALFRGERCYRCCAALLQASSMLAGGP